MKRVMKKMSKPSALSIGCIQVVLVILVGISTTLVTAAQDKATVREVSVRCRDSSTDPARPCTRSEITVVFTKSFTDQAGVDSAEDVTHYGLLDAKTKTFLPITGLAVRPPTGRPKTVGTVVTFQTTSPLAVSKDRYQVLVSDVTFGDVKLEKTSLVAVKFDVVGNNQNAQVKTTLEAAEDRDSSDFNFNGEITRASGTPFNGTADVKVRYPILANFWRTEHSFSPLFDLKASTDPKQDPDTMKIGAEWIWLLTQASSGILRQIEWRNSGFVESNRDFANSNFLWGTRFVFLSGVAQNDSNRQGIYQTVYRAGNREKPQESGRGSRR